MESNRDPLQETKQEKDDKQIPLTKEQEQKLQSACHALAETMNQGNEKHILKTCENILSEAKKANLLEPLVKNEFTVVLKSADEKEWKITGTPLEICFEIARKDPTNKRIDYTLANMLLSAGEQPVLPVMKAAVNAGHYSQVKYIFQNFFMPQLIAGFASKGLSCPDNVVKTVNEYAISFLGSPSDAPDYRRMQMTFFPTGKIAKNKKYYDILNLFIEAKILYDVSVQARTPGESVWFPPEKETKEDKAGYKLTLFELKLLKGPLHAAAEMFIEVKGDVKARPEVLKHLEESGDHDFVKDENGKTVHVLKLLSPDEVIPVSYDGTIFAREQGKTILHLLTANPAFEMEHCRHLLNLWHDEKIESKDNPNQQRHLEACRRAINQLDPEGYTPIMRALAIGKGEIARFLHEASLAEFPDAQQSLQSHIKLAELFKQISQNKDHLSLTVNFLGIFYEHFLEPAVAKQVLGEKFGLSYDLGADQTLLQLFLESRYDTALQWYIKLLLPPLPEKQAADETKSESKTVDAELREEPSDHIGGLLLQLSILAAESKFASIQKFLQLARNLGSLNQRADFLKIVCNLKDAEGFTVLMHIITAESDPSVTRFYYAQSGKRYAKIASEISAIPDLVCAAKFFSAQFANGIPNPICARTVARTFFGANLGMNLLDKKTGKSFLRVLLEMNSKHNSTQTDKASLKWYITALLAPPYVDNATTAESKEQAKEPSQDSIKFLTQELEYLYNENPGSYAQPLSTANILLQAIQDSCVPEICQHRVVLKHTYRIKDSMGFTQVMRDIRDLNTLSRRDHVENILNVTGISYAEVLQDIFAINHQSLALKFMVFFREKFKDPSVMLELTDKDLITNLIDKSTQQSLLRFILETNYDPFLESYLKALLAQPSSTESKEIKEIKEIKPTQSLERYLIEEINELFCTVKVYKGIRTAITREEAAASREDIILQPNLQAAKRLLLCIQKIAPDFLQQSEDLSRDYRRTIMSVLLHEKPDWARELLQASPRHLETLLLSVSITQNTSYALRFIKAFLPELKKISDDDHAKKTSLKKIIQTCIQEETIKQLLQEHPVNHELVDFLISQGAAEFKITNPNSRHP